MGIFLPENAAAEVLRWRCVYPGILSEMVPPHITLVYSPFVPEAEWAQVRPALADCLRVFEPFDVTLKTVGTFPGDPAFLWLKPDDSGLLRRIRDTLAQRFPQYVPPSSAGPGFVPHVTVSVFNSDEGLLQARQAVAKGLAPVRFSVREFSYWALGQDDEWRDLDQLYLGQTVE